MSTREWKVLQLNKEVTELKIHESGSMEIEMWKYDPELFAWEGVVDPLSLYLSLKNTKDERVEMALEQQVISVSQCFISSIGIDLF